MFMQSSSAASWYHDNRYHAQVTCEHCAGVVRHEPWCISLNSSILYAYQIVADATILTLSDRLILHALGVQWIDVRQESGAAVPF
jgi:hypothetical protein